MNINHYECGNLFGASRSLLEGSGLVRYCGDSFVFNGDEAALESWWEEKFDPKFGRYMAWVWFSVGAENLAKAALVCNGLLEAKQQNYSYPVYWGDSDKGSWVEKVLGSRRNAGGGYGEMGDIWRYKLDDLSRQARRCRGRTKRAESGLQVSDPGCPEPRRALIRREPAQKGPFGG